MNRVLSGRNSLLVYSCTPCYSNFTQNTLFWHLEEELSLSLLLPPSFLAHQLLGNMEAHGSHQLSANRLGQKKTTMTFIGGSSSIPTSTHTATSFKPWFENCFKKGRQSQTPLMDTVKRQELQTVQKGISNWIHETNAFANPKDDSALEQVLRLAGKSPSSKMFKYQEKSLSILIQL